MHLRQETAAELNVRPASRKHFVDANQAIEQPSLRWFELVDLCPQSPFQILQHHRYQADIGNAIPDKSVTHKLGAKRAQVNHARAANEWANEPDHKIDGVVGWKNTQIA